MTHGTCRAPLALPVLVEYWLGELDAAREEAVERHLFGCGACCETLQGVVDLAGGVRALVRRGEVGAAVTDGFVRALAAAGLRLREYRVPRDGSVHCTVAPDDDVLVARLEAPLAGVPRLDLETSDAGGDVRRIEDIPFDAAANEVVLVPRIDRIRALAASTSRMRLVAVGRDGERVLGDYGFVHSPWPPAG